MRWKQKDAHTFVEWRHSITKPISLFLWKMRNEIQSLLSVLICNLFDCLLPQNGQVEENDRIVFQGKTIRKKMQTNFSALFSVTLHTCVLRVFSMFFFFFWAKILNFISVNKMNLRFCWARSALFASQQLSAIVSVLFFVNRTQREESVLSLSLFRVPLFSIRRFTFIVYFIFFVSLSFTCFGSSHEFSLLIQYCCSILKALLSFSFVFVCISFLIL